jgi:hypothetical protein
VFRGEGAAHALDAPANLVIHEQDVQAPERLTLTSRDQRWVPASHFEIAARGAYLQPVTSGYPGLVQLHDTIDYRAAPALRVGMDFDARLNWGTALLGSGPSANLSVGLGRRWILSEETAYLLGVAAHGRRNWSGQWFHGPSAALGLGYGQRGFLGSPSALESGAFGPVASVEYLFLPERRDHTLVIGIGFFVRYGL